MTMTLKVNSANKKGYKMSTIDEIQDAIFNEIGFCTNCMEFTTSPVDPEHSHVLCEQCTYYSVFGASMALRNGYVTQEED